MIDRTGLPQVLLFLLLAWRGTRGTQPGQLHARVRTRCASWRSSARPVLFSDAVGIDVTAVGGASEARGPVLGPGILDLGCAHRRRWMVVPAISVSPHPRSWGRRSLDRSGLMRSLLRRETFPPPPAGAPVRKRRFFVNDVVLLPIVLIAWRSSAGDRAGRLRMVEAGTGSFRLGPGPGVGTGLIGIALLDFIRKRFGVRRDYESLYALEWRSPLAAAKRSW